MRAATLVTNPRGSISRNLANVLTSLRLALALPTALLVVAGSRTNLILAALLFGSAALSDLLDGRVARRQARVSTLGCFLDPLADKCAVDSCIVALLLVHAFPAALAVLFIGRDITVTGLRLARGIQPALLAPSPLAKAKTAALYLGVGGLILGRVAGGALLPVSWLFVGAAAVLSLLSAAQYIRNATSALPAFRIPR